MTSCIALLSTLVGYTNYTDWKVKVCKFQVCQLTEGVVGALESIVQCVVLKEEY